MLSVDTADRPERGAGCKSVFGIKNRKEGREREEGGGRRGCGGGEGAGGRGCGEEGRGMGEDKKRVREKQGRICELIVVTVGNRQTWTHSLTLKNNNRKKNSVVFTRRCIRMKSRKNTQNENNGS